MRSWIRDLPVSLSRASVFRPPSDSFLRRDQSGFRDLSSARNFLVDPPKIGGDIRRTSMRRLPMRVCSGKGMIANRRAVVTSNR